MKLLDSFRCEDFTSYVEFKKHAIGLCWLILRGYIHRFRNHSRIGVKNKSVTLSFRIKMKGGVCVCNEMSVGD